MNDFVLNSPIFFTPILPSLVDVSLMVCKIKKQLVFNNQKITIDKVKI
jgi:hypothetical protein